MKAALYHEYGPPEVLKYEDIAPLPVGPRDAMLKVRATSLNWFDVIGRNGEYRPNKTLPHILGCGARGLLSRSWAVTSCTSAIWSTCG